MESSGYLSAQEAAHLLGIRLSTLYSYVSRGLLRSEFADRSRRTRRYPIEDVQRLRERQEVRQEPQRVVDTALHWGAPMLDSALTLIEGGRCYYRGQEICALAQQRSVEQVAALIWLGEESQADALFAQEPTPLSPACEALLTLLSTAPPIERLQAMLPLMAAEDLAAYDLRPLSTAQTGARLLKRMVLLSLPAIPDFTPGDIARTLQRGLAPDRPQSEALFRAALILCADHELNVSSFTARCVASAGSTPYAVVSGGLAALSGVKHGGSTERVEALFRETASPNQARAVLAGRIRRGETLPGFGHPLYPQGDPRGRLLVELAQAAVPNASGVELALALAAEAQTALHLLPNVDFGLATLSAALNLPAGMAITLFALGRTIGWIGHAIETYQTDRLIRPRAHYTGILPDRS